MSVVAGTATSTGTATAARAATATASTSPATLHPATTALHTATGTGVTRATSIPTLSVPASARTAPPGVRTATTTTTTRAFPGASSSPRPLGSTVPSLGFRPSSGAHRSTHLSDGAIALAALAAVLLLACAAWALARWRAYEPRWLISLRHALAEAGFRMSATWAEFTDWLRLGH